MTKPSITQRERNLTLAALLVVFLLGALDQTIISTAMPRIIEQLGGLNLYTWVTTAYLLSSTVMVPIYGKLSDIYGRKPILVVGISIFLLGSWLSGLSGEFGDLPLLGGGMTQLIIFRAVQGLGGAALFSSAFAIIADMIPAAERGKYQGLFGGTFGVAAVLGPLIGGFFTDMGTTTVFGLAVEGWRWVFYVNLPVGVLALFMIMRVMPPLPPGGAKGRIDFVGAALIITTFVPMLLALSWGGSTYPWGSPVIVWLLVGSAVSLAAFLFVESRVPNPMISLSLFRLPVFVYANLAAFIVNVAFLGIVLFLPLFMQLVLGVSATNSGFTLLPLMGGMITSSFLAGLLVTRTGKYKPIMIAGSVLLLIGVALLTQISLETSLFGLGWRMVIVGVGLGPAQSQFTLAIQNAVPFSQMGVATSASQFFRQIGSSIGLAIFGTLLTLSVQAEIPKYVPQVPGMEQQTFDLNSLMGLGAHEGAPRLSEDELREAMGSVAAGSQEAQLAAQVEHGIKQGFAAGIRHLMVVSFFIMVAGAIAILFIPALPLRKVVASQVASNHPDGQPRSARPLGPPEGGAESGAG